MNKINKMIDRMNFKKIAIIYVVTTVIMAILSGIFLGYKFKDKILFAKNYKTLSESFEEEKNSSGDIENDITSFADKSNDIIDILVLDKENKILFSAKDSVFSNNDFALERTNEEKKSYLTYSQDKNITFKLVSDEELMMNTIFSQYEKEIKHEHDNDVFFKNNFNSKEIYLLSYSANKSTGDKIYFISKINPVQNGKIYIKAVSTMFILLFMVYWVLLALYVYQNARKSKINPYLWTSITLVTNIAGFFIYLVYKQNNQTCYKCGAVQNKSNVYCTYCGVKISNTCSDCNSVVNRGDKFCRKCGCKVNNEESEK